MIGSGLRPDELQLTMMLKKKPERKGKGFWQSYL
jgi:hypothetical protein